MTGETVTQIDRDDGLNNKHGCRMDTIELAPETFDALGNVLEQAQIRASGEEVSYSDVIDVLLKIAHETEGTIGETLVERIYRETV